MLTTAGIAAAGQVLGGIGSMISASKKSVSWRRMLQIQQDQQRWQEKMANTALQRQMNDAKAAGLNPMYLASSSGAPMPQGVTSGLTAETPDYGQILQTMASALQDIQFKKEQIKTEKKVQKKTEAETNKIIQDIEINKPEEEYKGIFGSFIKAVKNKFNLNNDKNVNNLVNKGIDVIKNAPAKIAYNMKKAAANDVNFIKAQNSLKEKDIIYYKKLGLTDKEINRLNEIKDRKERIKTAEFLFSRRVKKGYRKRQENYYKRINQIK